MILVAEENVPQNAYNEGALKKWQSSLHRDMPLMGL
jgi:hypothetical protein